MLFWLFQVWGVVFCVFYLNYYYFKNQATIQHRLKNPKKFYLSDKIFCIVDIDSYTHAYVRIKYVCIYVWLLSQFKSSFLFAICCFSFLPRSDLVNKRQCTTFSSCVIFLRLVLLFYSHFSNFHMFIMFRYFSLLAIHTRSCPSLLSSGLLLYIELK